MEFHEKLQILRKQKGLTQEELAQKLYVSRTAISKWESNRGYPNIDSLKAISEFFSVSLDELLSSDTVLKIAEEDRRQKEKRMRSLVFGLCDCCMGLLLFLPLFRQESDHAIQSVSLLTLHVAAPYIKIADMILVFAVFLWGILNLTLQTCTDLRWQKIRNTVSMGLSAVGTIIFIIGLQPYAAVFAFLFLAIKEILLIKRT